MLNGNKSLCAKTQSTIVSAEKTSRHTAHNNDANLVYHYKMDGDVLPAHTEQLRCDYLLENDTKKEAYLIELKGTDVPHAIDQIEATLCLFSDHFRPYTIKPRIVYRGNTHAVNSSKVVRFKRKYPRAVLKTSAIEENI